MRRIQVFGCLVHSGSLWSTVETVTPAAGDRGSGHPAGNRSALPIQVYVLYLDRAPVELLCARRQRSSAATTCSAKGTLTLEVPGEFSAPRHGLVLAERLF